MSGGKSGGEPVAIGRETGPATTRGVTLAALIATLGNPTWWLLALAGFFARGGILVFVLAIVSLPSPLVLSNILGPVVVPLALGRLSGGAAALFVVGCAIVVGWLLVGGWLAAATEMALVRDAHRTARDEGLPTRSDGNDRRWLIPRAAAAHLICHVPSALTLLIGGAGIVAVIYRELTNPSEAGPLALRVMAGAVVPIGAIVGVWILGEIAGGLAVRRIVLGGEGLRSAVPGAVGDLIRRPVGSLLAPLATTFVLAVDLGAVLAVVAVVLAEVRERLIRPLADPLATTLTVVTLGAAWSMALIVTGLIAAWRSAAMTFEAERAAVAASGGLAGGLDGEGTIGVSADTPTGG